MAATIYLTRSYEERWKTSHLYRVPVEQLTSLHTRFVGYTQECFITRRKCQNILPLAPVEANPFWFNSSIVGTFEVELNSRPVGRSWQDYPYSSDIDFFNYCCPVCRSMILVPNCTPRPDSQVLKSVFVKCESSNAADRNGKTGQFCGNTIMIIFLPGLEQDWKPIQSSSSSSMIIDMDSTEDSEDVPSLVESKKKTPLKTSSEVKTAVTGSQTSVTEAASQQSMSVSSPDFPKDIKPVVHSLLRLAMTCGDSYD